MHAYNYFRCSHGLRACTATLCALHCDCSWPIHNTSASIRQALIYDYVKLATACPDGDPGGHLHPRQPNEAGIWDDWSDEVRRYASQYPAAPAGKGDMARL